MADNGLVSQLKNQREIELERRKKVRNEAREILTDPDKRKAFEEKIPQQFGRISREIQKAFFGEPKAIETALLGMATEQHVVFVGEPGGGKSVLTDAIGRVSGLETAHVDCHPEMTFSDTIGGVNMAIFTATQSMEHSLQRGPMLVASIIRLEEITRAHPRIKAMFMKIMQDRWVQLPGFELEGGVRPKLYAPRPQIIFATMNDKEAEKAAYDLTSGELNRYGARYRFQKKGVNDFVEIARSDAEENLESISPVISREELLLIIQYVRLMTNVSRNHPILRYVARIAHKMQYIADETENEISASARCVHSFWRLLNAYKLIKGLSHLTPEHVLYLINRSWHHRVAAAGEDRRFALIDKALEQVSPIPLPGEDTFDVDEEIPEDIIEAEDE